MAFRLTSALLLIPLLLGPTRAVLAQGAAPSAAPADAVAADDAAPGSAAPLRLPAPQDTTQDNLGRGGLAVQGYDPVAYFPEGGGRAVEGSAKFETTLHGVRYRFANEQHRQRFEQDPGRYVPAYGGWCAFAMADGEKVEVDPESFLVADGRLLLFYDGLFNDTRASWLKDPAALERRADEKWRALTGQQPRGDRALQAAADAAAVGGQPTPAAGPHSGAAGTAAAAIAEVGANVGQLAPPFTLKDAAGVAHSLADWRGQLVLLDFWATWCGPCKLAMPGVQRLHEQFQDRGVVVVGVNGFERKPEADPAGYMAGKGYTYRLLLGGEALAQSYAIDALPSFVLIDGEGRVLARHVGAPADEGELARLIEAQLATSGADGGG